MKKEILMSSDVKTEVNEDTINLDKAFVEEDNRVLDPTLLDKSILERMPQPTGWRLLVLPYKGKGVRYEGERIYRKEGKKK